MARTIKPEIEENSDPPLTVDLADLTGFEPVFAKVQQSLSTPNVVIYNRECLRHDFMSITLAQSRKRSVFDTLRQDVRNLHHQWQQRKHCGE